MISVTVADSHPSMIISDAGVDETPHRGTVGVSFQLPWVHHFELLQETKKQTVRLEAINKFEGFRFHRFTYVVVVNTFDASGWKLWNHSRTFKSHPGGQHWQCFFLRKKSRYLWCVFCITCIKNHEKPKISKDCPFEPFEGLRGSSHAIPSNGKIVSKTCIRLRIHLGTFSPASAKVLFWPCWYFDILCMQSQSFREHIHSWFAGPFKSFLPVLVYEYIELSTKKWINFIFNPLLPFKE